MAFKVKDNSDESNQNEAGESLGEKQKTIADALVSFLFDLQKPILIYIFTTECIWQTSC